MGGGEFGAETLLVLDEMRFLDPEQVCLASLIYTWLDFDLWM